MNLNLLYKYFEGKATQEEEATIKQWLDSSNENMKTLLKERKIYDSMLLLPALTTNKEEHAPAIKFKKPRFKIYLREFAKIASVIIIAVLSTIYWLSVDEVDEMAMQTINVPAGQRLNLLLPDGTDVWVNSKTTIKYPVSFNKKERLVEIDGQAYFDVAQNKDVPFVVKTREGRVQALGTKFDVLAYSIDHIFETMLLEGSVKVELLADPNQVMILQANDRVYLSDGKLRKEEVKDVSNYEWRNGLLSFKNKSFVDIIKTFERVYDVKIVIENSNLNHKLLTAKFRTVDGLDYSLQVLQGIMDFTLIKNKESKDDEIIYIQ